jgi:hypothetical protein
VLNSGSDLDDTRMIFEKYRDFDLRIVPQAWGIKLEIKNAPAAAFVDGEMIRGLKDHLFAVLRDVVFISNEIVESGRFDLTPPPASPMRYFISCATPRLGAAGRPNLVVCWGGHSIRRVEYDYTKKVGYELGLRGLGRVHRLRSGRHEGPHEGSDHRALEAAHRRRALSGHHRARHHRGRAAQPDRQPVGDHAGHRKAPGGIRASGPRHRDFPWRRRHRRGDPVLAGHCGSIRPTAICRFPVVFTGPADSAEYFQQIHRFIGATLGPKAQSATRSSSTIPAGVARAMVQGLAEVRDYRRQTSDSYGFNWLLKIPLDFQQPFEVTHESMRALRCRTISRCTNAPRTCGARSPESSPAISRSMASTRSSATGLSSSRRAGDHGASRSIAAILRGAGPDETDGHRIHALLST